MKKILASLISLLLFVALSLPVSAAFAIVGGAFTSAVSGDTNSVTTGSIDTTGADLLLVCIGDRFDVTKTTLSDNKSNTWVEKTSYGVTSGGRARIFYATNVSGKVGSGHTFTATGSLAYPAITVRAFSGAHLTAPEDLNDGANTPNSATTAQAASGITPSANNYLVVACTSWNGDTAVPTINGGFSAPDGAGFGSGVNFGVAASYLIQTSAALARPTWSYHAVSSIGGNSLLSLKVAAGGGGAAARPGIIGGGLF